MKLKIASLLVFVWAVAFLSACASSSTSSGQPERTVEKNKASAEATRNVGEAYLNGGNLMAALRELKKAEALDPDDHITQYDLGLVYYARERYDQAIPHLERAVKLKPDYAPAINSLGNVYAAKGDWDKAIEAYEQIIEDAFYGTPYFALSNMGLAYYHKKDYPKAEKYFFEALKMSPDFTNALGGLGTTYIAMGRYQDAVVRLERAVQKEPKFPQLHFELGRAYKGLGNKHKAQEEFRRVIELAPTSPLAADAQRELKNLQF